MRIPFSLLIPALLAAFMGGVLVAGTVLTPSLTVPSASIPTDSLQVAFCPSPDCVSNPLSAIDAAHSRVWVAMYSFTHDQLGDALVRAHARGVDVQVILEKQEDSSKYSEHSKLTAAGIPVRLDSNPQLMHNKFAVIDDDFVITGSMNWTQNGVKENNENELVIHSKELNAQFASEFQKLWDAGNQ